MARRYASALFDVAQKNQDIDRVARDLSNFRTLVGGHAELRSVFQSPAVPHPRKRAIIDALMKASGGENPVVRRLLEMLADRDRLGALDEIADAFTERVMHARRVMAAELVTAEPLDPAHRTALAGALERATGNEVTISERVDPGIIGGIVARVGSVVFDGSVMRQLERLRQELLST